MRSLLAMERIALNFLQRLSGIAHLTEFRARRSPVRGPRSMIRAKTTPGWRALEKYAVRCGGGVNDRFGLFDAVLIKDNHLAWLQGAARAGDPGPIVMAIAAARSTPAGTHGSKSRSTHSNSLRSPLFAVPTSSLSTISGRPSGRGRAAARPGSRPSIQLEASGGVNLATVRALAQSGVDRISVGALDAFGPVLDLAVRLRAGACATAV